MTCSSSIVTLVRFPYIKTINNPDVLYAITDLSILACTEVSTCIIATSAGTLRPLFIHYFKTQRQPSLPQARVQNDMVKADEGTGTTTIADLESTGDAITHFENPENVTELRPPSDTIV